MLWTRIFVILVMCCFILGFSTCPDQCKCNLDDKGRKRVLCTQGHMNIAIPVTQIDQDIEVVIITAPKEAPNRLTIGPIFQQFHHLEELHVVRSNVPAIGRHTFWGVPTLRVLNLTQNNITAVVDNNFRGLVNLLELYLDDNKIESLTSGTFRYLSELKVLSLANNRISELVPRLFLSLGKLHDLQLSGNPLYELTPEVFKDIQELRALKCRSCGLRSVNTQIYHLLPYLAYLDLGENEFKYIMADEFRDLRRLRKLWLDGNQLPVVLEKTFGNQDGLEYLNLARNRLAKVTNTAFTNLSSLVTLDLSYNKLDRLETESFHPIADSLQNLNISGNNIPIGELKYVLQVVTKVQRLHMAQMSLTDLPLRLFDFQDHLLTLNLSRNNFASFPLQVIGAVSTLAQLDMSGNKLRDLDEKVLIKLESIPKIHLDHNPWACDLCHLLPMINRINTSSASARLKDLRCVTPHTLADRTIGSMQRSELDWCNNVGYDRGGVASISHSFLGEDGKLGIIAAGAAVSLLLITSIALTIGICYSRRQTANYYTNEEKRGPESEAIFENPTAILGENGEISFKFPLDANQSKNKKVSISTIDEIKKDPVQLKVLSNGNGT